MKITASQEKGQREYQEDRGVLLSHRDYSRGDYTLIAVFDGHGGSQCVSVLGEELSKGFYRYVGREPHDFIRALYDYLNERTKDLHDGSTGSMVLITPTEIISAVLGDSPIQILFKDGLEYQMPEHNVRSNQDEAQAVMSRGGVIQGGYLFDPNNFYRKGLQMSRAFGDTELSRVLERVPTLSTIKRDEVQSILIASDGLIDPAHGVNPFVLNKMTDAVELVEANKNSFDNVTAFVVQF